ncbi:hypothetical protein V5799_007615 [Amblyomma americanum]|uniref:Uncharacterized protein n=1 Tax=Amblyomma americanum TaxID=6943 RepID=A0AAQ4FGV2_AMBAM
MAVHESHPGRTCRSVSFDDGKRRVIATDLDPDVDPLNLKPILGRPPTPRPSRTDCTTSSSPDGQYDELGEGSSRPPSAASEEGVSAAAAALRMEMEVCMVICCINSRMSLFVAAVQQGCSLGLLLVLSLLQSR